MKTTLAGAIQQIDGQPIQACYVGVDAAERLAAFGSDRLGAACLVVADENTLAAGGERLLRALSAASRKIVHKTYGADPLDATEDLGKTSPSPRRTWMPLSPSVPAPSATWPNMPAPNSPNPRSSTRPPRP